MERRISLFILLAFVCGLSGFAIRQLVVGGRSGDALVGLVARAKTSIFRIEVQGGFGTGFLITPDGVVVTNYHVIEDAKEIHLVAANGVRRLAACVINEDAERDLALLKIDGPVESSFNSTRFLSEVPEGLGIAVIGNPMGLGWTASQGNVSALRGEQLPGFPKAPLIQISAPVSPGSSGSPLLDLDGSVLGVVTMASFGEAQNLNFAVPIEEAMLLLLEGQQKPCRDVGAVTFDLKFAEPDYDPDDFAGCPIDKFSKSPVEWLKMGYLKAFQARDWKAVYSMSKHLIQRCPAFEEAYRSGSIAAFKLNKIQWATTAFEKSLSLCQQETTELPDGRQYRSPPATCWERSGEALFAAEENERSESAFRKAVTLNPESIDGWIGLAKASSKLGKRSHAEAAFQAAIKLADESLTVQTQKGQDALLLGVERELVSIAISSAFTDLIDAGRQFGVFLNEQRRPDESRALIYAINKKPGIEQFFDVRVFDYLGQAWGEVASGFERDKRHQEEISSLQIAIKLAEDCTKRFKPTNPPSGLECAFWQRGQYRYRLARAFINANQLADASALIKAMKADNELSERSAKDLHAEMAAKMVSAGLTAPPTVQGP